MLLLLENVFLFDVLDRRFWSLSGNGDFFVALARAYIDEKLLPVSSLPTRWIRIIPTKINVFAWSFALDMLPTTFILDNWDVDVPSLLCPLCDLEIESVSHLFFGCSLTSSIFIQISRLWRLMVTNISSYGVDWSGSRIFVYRAPWKSSWKVFSMAWWHIWNFTKALLFGVSKLTPSVVFDNIVT